MGRSSAEQALQNRARIVEIASNLFRARGIDAVSVADIMAEAGMTVGGFYKHFASKEALVEEATSFAFDDALTLWKRIFAKPGATPDDLRARLVAQYLRPNPQRHCPIIAFAPHAASGQASASASEAYGKGTGALLDVFSSGNPPQEVAPGIAAADRQTLLVFAAMVGARVLGEAAGDAAWVEAIRQAVAESAAEQARGEDTTGG